MIKKGICGATLLFMAITVSGAVTLFDFEDGKSPKILAKT